MLALLGGPSLPLVRYSPTLVLDSAPWSKEVVVNVVVEPARTRVPAEINSSPLHCTITAGTVELNGTVMVTLGFPPRERAPVPLRPYVGRLGRKAARALARQR